jgi:hypothetical protein
VNAAILSFGSIQKGIVPPGGSTGATHARSLMRLNTLIRSLAEVRLEGGMHNVERVPVREILDEVGVAASLVARTRGIQFIVTQVDETPWMPTGRSSPPVRCSPELNGSLRRSAHLHLCAHDGLVTPGRVEPARLPGTESPPREVAVVRAVQPSWRRAARLGRARNNLHLVRTTRSSSRRGRRHSGQISRALLWFGKVQTVQVAARWTPGKHASSWWTSLLPTVVMLAQRTSCREA